MECKLSRWKRRVAVQMYIEHVDNCKHLMKLRRNNILKYVFTMGWCYYDNHKFTYYWTMRLPVVVLTSQRRSVKLSSLNPPGRDSLMPLAIWTGPTPFQLYTKSSVVQPSRISILWCN